MAQIGEAAVNQRNVIIASVGLNVLLAAGLWFTGQKRPDRPRRVVTKVIANTVAVTDAAPVATNSSAAEVPRSFRWSMVESDDFPTYIANLRAIECPEQTIRDIIRADVNELFVNRRQSLLEPFQRVVWELMARGEEALKEKKIDEQIEALEKEKEKLLERLLGRDRGAAEGKSRRFYPSPQYDFLPADKQQQVAEHLEKFTRLRQDVQSQQTAGADRAERYKALTEQSEAGLRELLTPEEYAEYKLRGSPAVHFAQNLYGFQPSEEEFRQIARLRMEFDTSQPRLNQKDADYQNKLADRQQSEKLLDERIKSVLGEERLTEFKRAQDPRFQEIMRVANRFDLPRDTAVNIFQVRQAAEQKAKEARANAAWEEDQRLAALEAIRRETEQAITAAFGSSGLRTYQRYGGGWIIDMTRGPSTEDETE
jgi:hypothetical protein